MTVYLIHLDAALGNPASPHGQARHYLGSTLDVDRRCQDHAHGAGAAMLRAATARGIPWRVVRTWPGGRALERKVKARKDAAALCPVCSGQAALRRGNYSDRETTKGAGYAHSE